jgi:hypothetical protein
MIWDSALTNSVGKTQCGNGPFIPCDYVGRIKHLGSMYANDAGLPITANADIVGPVGGFGWKIELDKGAPKSIRISKVEVDPATHLLVSIAYPPGTSFQIAAYAHPSCVRTATYTCSQNFSQVDSVAAVRNSLGNTYYVDPNGVLTFRVIQNPRTFIGRPDYFLPQYSDPGRDGLGLALDRFERYGMRLPVFGYGPIIGITAECPSTGAYCTEVPPNYMPEVCPDGYAQIAYDKCGFTGNFSPTATPVPTSSPTDLSSPPLNLSFFVNTMPTQAKTNEPTLDPASESTSAPVPISNIFLRKEPTQSIGKAMLQPVSRAHRIVTNWYSSGGLLLMLAVASWVLF